MIKEERGGRKKKRRDRSEMDEGMVGWINGWMDE